MNFENGKSYQEYAKVVGINSNDDYFNLSVIFTDKTQGNIKVSDNKYEINNVYYFSFDAVQNEERISLKATRIEPIGKKIEDGVLMYNVLSNFYPKSPVSVENLKNRINGYLNSIKNENISAITNAVFHELEEMFYVYPAATKLHHAYIGGLAYHTISMLDLVLDYKKMYDFLNTDYLYAGILLHDLEKVYEFSRPYQAEYTNSGHLLGHSVMGALNIHKIASKLGLEDTEEAMLLEHILISHHGQAQFGAARRPMTPEALLIWYLDSIDSKMRVLEEEFSNLAPGTLSSPISVLDKMKFYKTK